MTRSDSAAPVYARRITRGLRRHMPRRTIVPMATVRKVRVGDKSVNGVDVPYTVTRNNAVELTLDDGTVLSLRPIVVNVTRTDERTEDGDRVYVVQHFVYVTVLEDKESQR